jgi:phosphoribosyl-ATP pyrophosphohydrolase/phosphoribosyl-AMP cyclohydrolase
MAHNLTELNWDSQGLIPAVVQDANSGEVLTLAYVSRESLEKTRELGETVFYSRSRNALWHKGETSGNTQAVSSLVADCDRDAVVIRVVPKGPACHTGKRSCFFEEVQGFPSATTAGIGPVLTALEQLIESRKRERPEGSYTTRLFAKGLKRILQKVGEEATETVVAGMSEDKAEFVKESADLLYHLLVALRALDVSLDQVAAELESRRK